MTSGGAYRVGNDDRERAVAELRRAAEDGRLSAEELDERTARARSARTNDELSGLLADLGHILERSGLAADLFEGQFPLIPPGSMPRLAREAQLGGGDDYELCFTVPIAARQQIVMLAAELDLPLWRIGYTVPAAGENESSRAVADIRLMDADGQPLPIPKKGFDHFD